jgi:hypothetical protein
MLVSPAHEQRSRSTIRWVTLDPSAGIVTGSPGLTPKPRSRSGSAKAVPKIQRQRQRTLMAMYRSRKVLERATLQKCRVRPISAPPRALAINWSVYLRNFPHVNIPKRDINTALTSRLLSHRDFYKERLAFLHQSPVLHKYNLSLPARSSSIRAEVARRIALP